jgi:hypothetical protein
MKNLTFARSDSNTNQPVSKRTTVEVLTAGANRGARLMQPSIRDFNDRSNRFSLSPVYVDPVPERALTLAREAGQHGIVARAVEDRIENVLPLAKMKRQPLIVSVDNPTAVASVLASPKAADRAVLIYLLARLPNDELLGIRGILLPGDGAERETGRRLFEKLSEVTARSGASAVLGSEGRAEHLANEPAYRQWFAEHMHANLTKAVAEIRPENNPFEVTMNGHDTLPLMIHESDDGWCEPSNLARGVVEQPSFAVVRGEDFAVAEVADAGVRMYVVCLRALDGKPAIRAEAVLDPETYREAEAERRARADREAAEALRRAEQRTISRTQPIFTTD